MRRSIRTAVALTALLSLGAAVRAADPTTVPTTNTAGNLLKDPTFDSVGEGQTWNLMNQNGADSSVAKDAGDHPSITITVNKVTATDWHAQLFQSGLSVTKGASYALSFTGKASAPRKIAVFLQELGSPYKMLSEGHAVDLTTDAKPQNVTFTATDTSTDTKLTIVVGQATGTVTLSDVSLTKSAE